MLGIDLKVDSFSFKNYFVINKISRPTYTVETTTESNGNLIDGSQMLASKISESKITIDVTLISDVLNGYSDINQLENILKQNLPYKELSKISFSDDPNWYYLAKLDGESSINIIDQQLGTLTISFTVPDGIKRAFNSKGPFRATKGSDGRYSVKLINEGTTDVPIKMTATMNAENGYVGMYTDYAITEIGNKEESDTVNYTMATTILNTTNFTEFKRYTGVNPENSRKGNDGTSKLVSEGGINYWRLDNPGTDTGWWHGSSYLFDFPADGTGHVGSKNVYSYFNSVFWAGGMGQTADMQVLFLDSKNQVVMGYDIYKVDTVGNRGVIEMLAGDGKGNVKVVRAISFTTSHQDNENPLNRPRGDSDIRKNGDTITFYWFGEYPKFVIPELKNVEITKCLMNQYQLGNRSGIKLMSYFDFRRLLIVNDGAQYTRDIKNRYQKGTKVTMTGADSKIQVNGMPRLTEKVDGSKLFTIPPGETVIYFQCSEWCTVPPTYEIEYQEASL